jgi:hypothetical protein
MADADSLAYPSARCPPTRPAARARSLPKHPTCPATGDDDDQHKPALALRETPLDVPT